MKRNYYFTFKHLCLLIIFLLGDICIYAQSFKAQIEEASIYYRLSFTVSSSNADNFTPPPFTNFEVLSGPSVSKVSNYQIINGHASHTEATTYTYILSAQKSGRLTIGPATIRVNGKILHSNSVAINAQNVSGNNKGNYNHQSQNNQAINRIQQAGSAITNHDLFINVMPSRTKIREQEAVLLTYTIHARLGVGLSNTSLIQKPDFKGLISQEIPLPGNQIQTSIEHINGKTYRKGTILQYIVFPQKSGSIVIPSITFDCAVVQQDNTMDLADAFFNGGGTISVQVRRTVPPITLQVEKLPQPHPANFSGAVGNFSIQAQVLNKKVKTNDVATYRITLNGLGNLKLITAPIVKFPNSFETYDAKTTDNTKITTKGLQGQLIFDYTFVPQNIGEYTIPATDFVFFDTESGTYKTIHTQPIKLNIEKGERSNADIEKQLALLKSDIRPLHSHQFTFPVKWGDWSYRILFIIVSICGFLFILIHKKIQKAKGNIYYERHCAAQYAIKQLETISNNKNMCADALNAINGYLIKAFKLDATQLTKDGIKTVLTQNGVSENDINDLNSIIEKCQFSQYAPESMQNENNLPRQAACIIEKISGVIKLQNK